MLHHLQVINMLIDILRTIYFTIFGTHMNYINLIGGQNSNAVIRIVILESHCYPTNLKSRDSQSSPLFKFNHILKLEDKILIENILIIK